MSRASEWGYATSPGKGVISLQTVSWELPCLAQGCRWTYKWTESVVVVMPAPLAATQLTTDDTCHETLQCRQLRLQHLDRAVKPHQVRRHCAFD